LEATEKLEVRSTAEPASEVMDSITSELETEFSFMSSDDMMEPRVEKIKELSVSGVASVGSDVFASSSFPL
jgi:hypothetical protein